MLTSVIFLGDVNDDDDNTIDFVRLERLVMKVTCHQWHPSRRCHWHLLKQRNQCSKTHQVLGSYSHALGNRRSIATKGWEGMLEYAAAQQYALRYMSLQLLRSRVMSALLYNYSPRPTRYHDITMMLR